jgi:hypothetical protein
MPSKIARVYTREVGGAISDTTLKYDCPFEIVVEVEAAYTAFSEGAQYAAGIVVKDLLEGGTFTAVPQPGTPPIGANDSMNNSAGNWKQRAQAFVYKVDAPGDTKENHIGEVLAFLRVGVSHPTVSFAESERFVITHP